MTRRNDGFERPIVDHPTGIVVDQLAQGGIHRRFVYAGLLHVATDAEQLGPPFFSGPRLANHSGPFSTIGGTLHSVSTLLTAVGHW